VDNLPVSQTLPQTRPQILQTVSDAVVAGLPSPHTRRAYGKRINDYLRYLSALPDILPGRSNVQAWLRDMRCEGAGDAAVNQALSAVKKLAEELGERGILGYAEVGAIQSIKTRKQRGVRTGNWLTEDEARGFVNGASDCDSGARIQAVLGESMQELHCPNRIRSYGAGTQGSNGADRLPGVPGSNLHRGSNETDWRDSALISLLIGCGLRRSEAAGLDWSQFVRRWDRWVLSDVIGKGGRVRTIAIPDWAAERVMDYGEASMAVNSASVGETRGEEVDDTNTNQSTQMGAREVRDVARDVQSGTTDGVFRVDGTREGWSPVHPMPQDREGGSYPDADSGLLTHEPVTTKMLPGVSGDSDSASGDETPGGCVNGHEDQVGNPGSPGRSTGREGSYREEANRLHVVRHRAGAGVDGETGAERRSEVREVRSGDGDPETNQEIHVLHNRTNGAGDRKGNPVTGDPKHTPNQVRTHPSRGSIFNLTPSGIFYVITQAAKRHGLTITPHDLRRTYAALSDAGGASIRQIQTELGHSSIATTERYLRTITGLRQGKAAGDHIKL
jgi:hypothetical protein